MRPFGRISLIGPAPIYAENSERHKRNNRSAT
jgi:hypothetical protein